MGGSCRKIETKRDKCKIRKKKVKLEKVGRNTAEAVILSAIESMDCWLLKKEESNLEKLYSLIVGMSDLGEEKKEKLRTVLQHFWMMIEEYEYEYDKEKKKAKLYKLLDLKEEKMYNLVVAMADFWEDDKGKLYFLMFHVDTYNPLGGNMEELMKKEKLCRLLIEMTDLWEGDEGEMKKKKLHSLLIEITDPHSGACGPHAPDLCVCPDSPRFAPPARGCASVAGICSGRLRSTRPMSKSSTTSSSAAATVIRPQDFADSPVHYAVASGDHFALNKLLSTLPKMPDPTSLAQERITE